MCVGRLYTTPKLLSVMSELCQYTCEFFRVSLGRYNVHCNASTHCHPFTCRPKFYRPTGDIFMKSAADWIIEDKALDSKPRCPCRCTKNDHKASCECFESTNNTHRCDMYPWECLLQHGTGTGMHYIPCFIKIGTTYF